MGGVRAHPESCVEVSCPRGGFSPVGSRWRVAISVVDRPANTDQSSVGRERGSGILLRIANRYATADRRVAVGGYCGPCPLRPQHQSGGGCRLNSQLDIHRRGVRFWYGGSRWNTLDREDDSLREAGCSASSASEIAAS